MSLSDTKIRTLKPKDKPYKVSDERGLFLLVNVNGSKLWRLKYRIEAKEKLLAFGAYPDVSLADAREARDEARKAIAAGSDPSELRKAIKEGRAEKAANSFEIVAKAWLKSYSSNISPATTEKNVRLFERDIFPWIGDRPIADLRPKEILDAARRIEARGAVDTAKRAIQLCGQVFKQAVLDEKVTSDPMRDIRRAIKPLKDLKTSTLQVLLTLKM